MIDLMLWRARIGLFHPLKNHLLLEDTIGALGECKVDATLTDILIFFAVLCAVAKLTWCLYNNSMFLDYSFCTHRTLVNLKGRGTQTDWMKECEVIEKSISQFSISVYMPLISVGILCLLCTFNAAWALRKILLSNDVEFNPGPDPKECEGHNVSDKKSDEIRVETMNTTSSENIVELLTAIQLQGNKLQSQILEQNKNLEIQLAEHNKQLQEQRVEMIKQNDRLKDELKEELNSIKLNIGKIAATCVEISERCNRLEIENRKLSERVDKVVEDCVSLKVIVSEEKAEGDRLTEYVLGMKEEMSHLNTEIDRLEEFSRRENLRMFGIAPLGLGSHEDYDMCTTAVCNALNNVDINKTWSSQDIVRAHRIGRARQGEHRPMIVKFRLWKDKMSILRDKDLRVRLEKGGVRVANDLTVRQASQVAMARREGKVAYFVKGRLTVGPKRVDTRGYAQVTMGVSEMDIGDNCSIPFSSNPATPQYSSPFRDQQLTRAAGGGLPRDEKNATTPVCDDMSDYRPVATMGGDDRRDVMRDSRPRADEATMGGDDRRDDTRDSRPRADEATMGGDGRRDDTADSRPRAGEATMGGDGRRDDTGGSRLRAGEAAVGGNDSGSSRGGGTRAGHMTGPRVHGPPTSACRQTGLHGYLRGSQGQVNTSPSTGDNYYRRNLRSSVKNTKR